MNTEEKAMKEFGQSKNNNYLCDWKQIKTTAMKTNKLITGMTAVLTLLMFATNSFAQGSDDWKEYYKAADGKSGAALKTALCGIIYNRDEGGDLNTAYKALWTHFQTTDALPNGKVWDMYSNMREFEFGTDQDKGSGGNKEGEYYNREHSWPNSWFGAKVMPMYTDLHHMYPTDKMVNGKRGNNPFGETNGEMFKSANNFSKLGKCTIEGYTGTVFEPNNEYKGDFARTYFYMVTCYEEQIPTWYTSYPESQPTLDGKTYPGLATWQLEMLLKWAKDDPVSEKETNRNNAVYGIQKNRNPFIDYPGLEQYVWGDKKNVAFSYDNYVSTDIQTIEADNAAEVWYTPDGRRLQKPRRGLNILRMKNGKNRKVLKK